MNPKNIPLKVRKTKGMVSADRPEIDAISAPPYFKSKFSSNVHRTRFCRTYFRCVGVVNHMAVEGWCGSGGFIHPEGAPVKGCFLYDLTDEDSICPRCEEAAVRKGGQPPSVTVFGKPARLAIPRAYRPRRNA